MGTDCSAGTSKPQRVDIAICSTAALHSSHPNFRNQQVSDSSWRGAAGVQRKGMPIIAGLKFSRSPNCHPKCKSSNLPEKSMPPLLRILIDLGPLLSFFVVEQLSNIFLATGVLMIAVIAAFAVSWTMTRQIPILPSATLVFVLIFGGLTLYLGNDEFIKIEVTLTNALCGLFLLGGLAMGKSLLKIAFGAVIDLDNKGWRKLTMRMGIFLIAIAAINEVVRQTLSTDIWVMFRVYGILGMTAVFFVTQMPLINRHLVDD